MKYSGIDLHSNNSVVVVTDEQDHVLEEMRVPNDLAVILKFLEPHREDLAGVVVESTFNGYWLVDGLMEAGHAAKLANPAAIKKYAGLKHSGDETDARHLAQLLRLGILPTGAILPKELRATRDPARKRMQLVRHRTMHILSVENITARQFGARINSNQVKRLGLPDIGAMPLPEDVKPALEVHVAVIATLSRQIEVIERRIKEQLVPRAEHRLLESVPGIGRILAPVILRETGPIERFADVGNYASYARCVESRYTSNGRKKGGRQYQERQQVSRLGLYRGGQPRAALPRAGAALL
jgi:transposase